MQSPFWPTRMEKGRHVYTVLKQTTRHLTVHWPPLNRRMCLIRRPERTCPGPNQSAQVVPRYATHGTMVDAQSPTVVTGTFVPSVRVSTRQFTVCPIHQLSPILSQSKGSEKIKMALGKLAICRLARVRCFQMGTVAESVLCASYDYIYLIIRFSPFMGPLTSGDPHIYQPHAVNMVVIKLSYCDQIFNSSTPVAHYMRCLS